jgi:hypothetical protein
MFSYENVLEGLMNETRPLREVVEILAISFILKEQNFQFGWSLEDPIMSIKRLSMI